MEWEIAVVDRRGRSTPVVVEAGADAAVRDLRRALTEQQGAVDGALFLGPRRLHDHERLDALVGADWGDGAALAVGRPQAGPPRAAARPDGRELAVIGGPAAGAALTLPASGAVVLGRSMSCDLSVDDPEVSRRHAELRVETDDAFVLTDAGSRNGTVRRGFRIDRPTGLALRESFQIGETVLSARPVPSADAQLLDDREQGVRRFNRPPRIPAPAVRTEVIVPAEPQRPRGLRFPLAMVLLPLAAAGALYLFMPNSRFYLFFLALSPLMAIAHFVTERRGGRKEYNDRLRVFRCELDEVNARMGELAVAEERAARDAMPDPAALIRIATGPSGRLFERRPANPDFLRLRAGLTDRPAAITPTGPGADEAAVPVVHAVPVPVDLVVAGVLGIAGPRPAVLATARALLTQAGVLHAPHDLGIVVITGTDRAADWDWAGWLPHTLPDRPDQSCRRLLATDLSQAQARIAELGRLVAERRGEQREALRDGAPIGRRMLLVLDGARRLRDLPGLADLLEDGPDAGVYAFCLDAEEQGLPAECRATIVVSSPSGSRVTVSRPGLAPSEQVLADTLSAGAAEDVARALAPLRVLGARFGDDDGLPGEVRYLDLAGLGDDPGPDDVKERWAAVPNGRSTRMLLGKGPSGPVEVDLRRDGPHALIAGTSGAGKSELLQTLVATLALGNTPDSLNFVLVDYKGGSAFADCRELPHCVGMVTDLDDRLAERALTSLRAELRRRESILAAAGAKDIEDYWAKPGGGRLPRLVIVIDEFASLAEEVPDFVNGVVGIGMRGRALGVHVVLATQRPGGVVTAELRANVNLRICLRVTSPADSTDVIEVADAARLSRHHPGRAYMRTGHTDLEILQCARVGRPRVEDPSDPAPSDDVEVTVRNRSIRDLGAPQLAVAAGPDEGHDGVTDLTMLVAAVRDAAAELGIAAPPGPWQPPLPETVTLAELKPASGGSPVAVPLGLADEPERQRRRTFILDLERSCPVGVAGMSRSGRSTALRTIAAALAQGTSPADVHLYILDFGGRTLAPLAAFPHCGARVDADEPDRVERLLTLLTAEDARRRRLLAAGGYGSLGEMRAAVPPEERPAYLVLLVDQYETFAARYAELDGGRTMEALEGLLRRGPAVGILPVVSTDRAGFGYRLSGAVATRLVLRQADAEQATAFGLHPRELPAVMSEGRAVVVPGSTELQIALLDPDPSGAAQTAAVERLAAILNRRWDGLEPSARPHRVDVLPESITLAELAALRVSPRPPGRAVCTVGAGGDHLAPVDIDLDEAGGTLLISGPPQSGRSAALAAVAHSLAGRRAGTLQLIAVCPRRSPLRSIENLPGVLQVVTASEPAQDLEDALEDASGPVAVLVDDAELLADDRLAGPLERLTARARDGEALVIAAGTTDDLVPHRHRGWLSRVRRGRCGVLLNPLSHLDGEVLEARLPRSTGGGWPPGRGLLVWRGELTAMQIPMPDTGGIGARSPIPRTSTGS
ncbi:FtsK/SpoIIIE domain-containing protein [Actinomadura livida]|uniref:FtsK/SpoIIIE domain-containing protein n=1 Tax=Actinomadura livida TaxID=79909 RepID=A0A7W7I7D2_9ACTN|nr:MULTISPECIES: FtsK/SpoIIIE domain-containing protein [Actinomadura]MBB4771810.1 S-DNA-T family DNA segregation ATPase FtsK/SpoIIIE [Actinomadura catellatispora]GGU02617.1 cell division protein FtsK [Actinomadura livida]